jgi:hypothetical protein
MSSDPPASQYKARKSPRTRIAGTARLRQPDWYEVEVRVCDLSSTGFMAECAEPVRIGGYIALDVPGIGPVRAQVRWQLGGRMGGMFLDPISLNRCEWTAVKAEPPREAA